MGDRACGSHTEHYHSTREGAPSFTSRGLVSSPHTSQGSECGVHTSTGKSTLRAPHGGDSENSLVCSEGPQSVLTPGGMLLGAPSTPPGTTSGSWS